MYTLAVLIRCRQVILIFFGCTHFLQNKSERNPNPKSEIKYYNEMCAQPGDCDIEFKSNYIQLFKLLLLSNLQKLGAIATVKGDNWEPKLNKLIIKD